MEYQMLDDNMAAIDIVHNCFWKLDRQWKWYNIFRWGEILSGESILIRASSHLLYQSEAILSLMKDDDAQQSKGGN